MSLRGTLKIAGHLYPKGCEYNTLEVKVNSSVYFDHEEDNEDVLDNLIKALSITAHAALREPLGRVRQARKEAKFPIEDEAVKDS